MKIKLTEKGLSFVKYSSTRRQPNYLFEMLSDLIPTNLGVLIDAHQSEIIYLTPETHRELQLLDTEDSNEYSPYITVQ